jgi:hypothetical protein
MQQCPSASSPVMSRASRAAAVLGGGAGAGPDPVPRTGRPLRLCVGPVARHCRLPFAGDLGLRMCGDLGVTSGSALRPGQQPLGAGVNPADDQADSADRQTLGDRDHCPGAPRVKTVLSTCRSASSETATPIGSWRLSARAAGRAPSRPDAVTATPPVYQGMPRRAVGAPPKKPTHRRSVLCSASRRTFGSLTRRSFVKWDGSSSGPECRYRCLQGAEGVGAGYWSYVIDGGRG